MGKLKKKLIVFGAGKIAEATSYYFNRDSEYQIEAYVVDDEFAASESYLGKPLVALSKVAKEYPVNEYSVFVAVGYQGLNAIRFSKYNYFKEKGYRFATYVSPYIQGDFTIGENSILMDNVAVQPKVTIGNNIFIWGGTMLGHHVTIRDHCWITGGCLIGGSVTIGEKSFVGIGGTISQEVQVGESCVVGASTFITKDMPNESVVICAPTDIFRLNSKQFVRMSSFFKS